MSGYCAIGSVKIEMPPAITIRIEITDARMGRSIKNVLNMDILYLEAWVCAGQVAVGEDELRGIGVTGLPGLARWIPLMIT